MFRETSDPSLSNLDSLEENTAIHPSSECAADTPDTVCEASLQDRAAVPNTTDEALSSDRSTVKPSHIEQHDEDEASERIEKTACSVAGHSIAASHVSDEEEVSNDTEKTTGNGDRPSAAIGYENDKSENDKSDGVKGKQNCRCGDAVVAAGTAGHEPAHLGDAASTTTDVGRAPTDAFSAQPWAWPQIPPGAHHLMASARTSASPAIAPAASTGCSPQVTMWFPSVPTMPILPTTGWPAVPAAPPAACDSERSGHSNADPAASVAKAQNQASDRDCSEAQPPQDTETAIKPQGYDAGYSDKVYALGTLGFDFGSEARRDSFLQQAGLPIQATVQQILNYLNTNPFAAPALTWTLNHDAQPIYAIRPEGAYAADGYAMLCRFVAMQEESLDSSGARGHQHASLRRVSIPGFLRGTTQLLNHHEIPVVAPELRGSQAWSLNSLIEKALGKAPREKAGKTEYWDRVEGIANFLERIYHDVCNLGRTSADRAINFAATVGFQLVSVYMEAIEAGTHLDGFKAEPNPVARHGADVWDVKATFFNPRRRLEEARTVYHFTIDVTDVVPFSIGDLKSWHVY